MPFVGLWRKSGCCSKRPPGMKKSSGETLFVALMPPQPATGKIAAMTSSNRLCFRFNFTSLYTIVRLSMLATPNSPGGKGLSERLPPWPGIRPSARAIHWWLVVCAILCLARLQASAQTDPRTAGNAEFSGKAEQAYEAARTRFQSATNDPDAAWQFGRACFDWADYATTNAKRAEIAEEGIAACRDLLRSDTNSIPGHYYLAMNLGQLARTKSLGALKIVTQMEAEFGLVLKLDPGYSQAGPDRNLGLLYLDAPGWPLSLGNNTKAREHLRKALERAPDYPENHLNLIEAELGWGEKKDAVAGLDALDKLWPDALKKYSGDDWKADWADWEQRRQAARDKTRNNSKAQSPAVK